MSLVSIFSGTGYKNNVTVWQGEHAATLHATGMLHTLLTVQVTEDIPSGGQLWLNYGDAFWESTVVDDQGVLLYIIYVYIYAYVYSLYTYHISICNIAIHIDIPSYKDISKSKCTYIYYMHLRMNYIYVYIIIYIYTQGFTSRNRWLFPLLPKPSRTHYWPPRSFAHLCPSGGWLPTCSKHRGG